MLTRPCCAPVKQTHYYYRQVPTSKEAVARAAASDDAAHDAPRVDAHTVQRLAGDGVDNLAAGT